MKQAYDRIDNEALWQVLMMYYGGRRFLNEIKNIYGDSEACVGINKEERIFFFNDVEMRQRWVLSP